MCDSLLIVSSIRSFCLVMDIVACLLFRREVAPTWREVLLDRLLVKTCGLPHVWREVLWCCAAGRAGPRPSRVGCAAVRDPGGGLSPPGAVTS